MLKTVATTKSTIDLLLPYSQLINRHTTTPSAASNEHTPSQKKLHPPSEALARIGWHFCYSHPQTSYGGDY